MGESYFGSAVDKKNVVYLHIDHNYGGAVKSNGKILEGEHGFAGEFGGMRVLNRGEQFRYVVTACRSVAWCITGKIIIAN